MSTEFKPKITYRMAAMNIDNDIASMYPAMMNAIANLPTTPQAYLRNWSMSDKDPKEHTLEDLNMRMQNRWPGKYKIVVEQKWNGLNYYINEYVFKFDTPKDETWFKLRYS